MEIPIDADAQLPQPFVEWMRKSFDPAIVQSLLQSFVQRPAVARVNLLKGSRESVRSALLQDGFGLQQVSGCDYAFIVRGNDRRRLSSHRLVLDGSIYLQSIASLLVPIALDPKPGERVLDLCAAPGSKTTQIGMLMNRQGELVANEPSHSRFFKLRANTERCGLLDSASSFLKLEKVDGYRLLGRYRATFDRILVDAPCSGEARFVRGSPSTFDAWKPRHRKTNAMLQKKLLGAAFQMAKPEGRVLYSTCTLSVEENEEVVDWALKKFGALIELESPARLPCETMSMQCLQGLLPEVQSKVLRLRPTELVEGFFMASFRRRPE